MTTRIGCKLGIISLLGSCFLSPRSSVGLSPRASAHAPARGKRHSLHAFLGHSPRRGCCLVRSLAGYPEDLVRRLRPSCRLAFSFSSCARPESRSARALRRFFLTLGCGPLRRHKNRLCRAARTVLGAA